MHYEQAHSQEFSLELGAGEDETWKASRAGCKHGCLSPESFNFSPWKCYTSLNYYTPSHNIEVHNPRFVRRCKY